MYDRICQQYYFIRERNNIRDSSEASSGKFSQNGNTLKLKRIYDTYEVCQEMF